MDLDLAHRFLGVGFWGLGVVVGRFVVGSWRFFWGWTSCEGKPLGRGLRKSNIREGFWWDSQGIMFSFFFLFCYFPLIRFGIGT